MNVTKIHLEKTYKICLIHMFSSTTTQLTYPGGGTVPLAAGAETTFQFRKDHPLKEHCPLIFKGENSNIVKFRRS